MKKILFSLLFILININIYSLTSTTDIYLFPFYNFTYVKGIAEYDNYKYDYGAYTGYKVCESDYKLKINSIGGGFGVDTFFNDYFGLYVRCGLPAPISLEKQAAFKIAKYENFEPFYNFYATIGPVFSLPINNYFSLCGAPDVSMLLVTGLKNNKSGKQTSIDTTFGIGPAVDLYAKLRIKYLSLAAGCAFAFYPANMVSSADSNIQYYSPEHTTVINLQPYVSIGFTFKEYKALNIVPAN